MRSKTTRPHYETKQVLITVLIKCVLCTASKYYTCYNKNDNKYLVLVIAVIQLSTSLQT